MTSRSKRRPAQQARARKEARLKAERAEWRRAMEQVQRNIARFESMHSMHGEKWVQSMLRYWRGRRDELKARRPKGTR